MKEQNLELQIGDKISIHGLKTIITGFNRIGENDMVCTAYGQFNIDLIKKNN